MSSAAKSGVEKRRRVAIGRLAARLRVGCASQVGLRGVAWCEVVWRGDEWLALCGGMAIRVRILELLDARLVGG